MEKLFQGPTNNSLASQGNSSGFDFSCYDQKSTFQMPFLQMLQTVDSSPEPHFQLLLSTLQQHQNKPWYRMPDNVQAVEFESCVTQALEGQCPSVPEVASHLEEADSPGNQSRLLVTRVEPPPALQVPAIGGEKREKRKRKRSNNKPSKNKEDAENQRMTHIAVERNRRKLMNEHLESLRALMPVSFVQRGDQASIIGGAIDFVKELEQLLQSLEAQKRSTNQSILLNEEDYDRKTTSGSSNVDVPFDEDEMILEKGGEEKIEVVVIQTHVNLKVLSKSRPGQLLRVITALEHIQLTVLHLNITSMGSSVLYSFNLKIEDDCKLESADEIAAAVHQVFSYINDSSIEQRHS